MAKTSNRFAAWIVIGRVFSMIATFLMPVILTRVLSVSDYGIFSQFNTLYMVMTSMFAWGIHTNLFYFYPGAEKNEQQVYVNNTYWMLLCSGLLMGGFLCLPFVQDLLFGDSVLSPYKYFVAVVIAIYVPVNMIAPLFTVRNDRNSAILFPAFVAVCRIVVVAGLGIAFSDIRIIMWGMVLYQIAMSLITMRYSLRDGIKRINISHMKVQLAYSLPFGVAVGLQLFSNYFDKIVSIKLLTPADYAIYSVAFMSIPGVSMLYDSLAQVNIVNMTKTFKENDLDGVSSLYKDFVQKTLSFSTPLIFCAALYSEEIMDFLFSTEYVASATYFRIYSLTFLVSMIGAGTILRSINKTKSSLIAFFITCIISLPATYMLISNYGLNGAILGAVINMMLPRFIQMGMEMHFLKKGFINFLPWKKIFTIMCVSVLLLTPLFVIKIILHPSVWISLVLAVIYVVADYVMLARYNAFVMSRDSVLILINKLLSKVRRN